MDNFEWITTIFVVISMTATTIIYHERRYATLAMKLAQTVTQDVCLKKHQQLRKRIRVCRAPTPQKIKTFTP